jgi:hypothetical protein
MGFLTGSTRHGAGGGTSMAPNRKTSEEDLNQFNLQLKSNPVYMQFMQDNGLVDQGRGVKLSRGQQGALTDRLVESGMTIPGGMHIDQAGNFNQKNRLARNTAIAAGIGVGGYFAAPYLASMAGMGGGTTGAVSGTAAGGSAAAGGAASPTIGSTIYGTGAAGYAGMGVAPSLIGSTAAGAGSMAGGGALTAAAGGAGGGAGGGGLMGALGGSKGALAMRGGSALFGALMSRQAQKSAMKRSPEEMAALAGMQGNADQLTAGGSSLLERGMPRTDQAGAYWSTLLNGNRSQMAMATAGPRAQITDIYRGAESNLERSGVRGAARDVAAAELGRDRASKIAGLTTGVQPMAAQALAGIGSDETRMGAGMLGSSGNMWSNLLGEGFENRQYGRKEGEKFGTSMGRLIFDMLSSNRKAG